LPSISAGISVTHSANVSIYGNLVYDNSAGITGQNNIDAKIFNNTIVNNDVMDIHIGSVGSAEEFELSNNIIMGAPIGIHNDNEFAPVEDYNLFYDHATAHIEKGGSSQPLGEHSIIADPLFTDITNNDYTLMPNSPAVDAGVDVGLTQDFAGNPVPFGDAPDIGAYESQVALVNHSPEIVPIPNQTVYEEEEISFTVEASDPDDDPVYYSATRHNGYDVSTVGATFTAEGQFIWMPEKYQGMRSYTFVFYVTDNRSDPVKERATITVLIRGDFDEDGDIDYADLDVIVASLGSVEGEPDYNPQADFDDDEDVDDDDYNIFASNWGRGSSVLPLIAKTGDTVNQNWLPVDLEKAYFIHPVVLAAMQTNDGNDTAAVRINDPTTFDMEIKVEEEQSKDTEIRHPREVVGYLTSEPGFIEDSTGRIIGEIGQISVNQPDHSSWHTVDLQQSHINPVVMAQVMTSNDGDPAHIRVQSIQGDSFKFQIEEWDYQDGVHGIETVGFMVLEQGVHTLVDDTVVEVGTIEVNQSFATGTFMQNFNRPPTLFSQCMTVNEADAVVTRQRNITRRGFQVKLREQEINIDSHATETVGYVAKKGVKRKRFR
jgi:hypothetical protein